MRKIFLAITLGLAFAVHVAAAYAQDCSPDRQGYVSCSSSGLTLSGQYDRSGLFSGTVRGTDIYGNSYRGTVDGTTDWLRGTTTITPPSTYLPSVTVTTTCALVCSSR